MKIIYNNNVRYDVQSVVSQCQTSKASSKRVKNSVNFGGESQRIFSKNILFITTFSAENQLLNATQNALNVDLFPLLAQIVSIREPYFAGTATEFQSVCALFHSGCPPLTGEEGVARDRVPLKSIPTYI